MANRALDNHIWAKARIETLRRDRLRLLSELRKLDAEMADAQRLLTMTTKIIGEEGGDG